MAARLGQGLAAVPGVQLADPVQANAVFAELPEEMITGLQQAGFAFHRWSGRVVRLVCAWDTRAEDVDALIAAARDLAAPGA